MIYQQAAEQAQAEEAAASSGDEDVVDAEFEEVDEEADEEADSDAGEEKKDD